jgi:hypothetical protein
MKRGALVIGFTLVLAAASASAQTVISANQSGEIIEVRNLTSNDSVVSGEIVNRSRREVRNVELLIRRMWQWKNEFQPGSEDLGTASYYTVERTIPAGAAVPFTYRQRVASTVRTDGQYETVVSVVGFSEIFPSESGGR